MDAAFPPPRFAWARLWLAVALTFAILPYAYGRWLVYFLRGANDVRLLGVVAVTVAVLLPLTWNLRPRLRGSGILLGWVTAFTGLVVWAAGAGMPLWQLLAVFVPSTVWVVWLAWLGVWPWRWPVRLGLLAVWLVLAVLGPALIRVEGFTGDTTGRSPTL